MTIFGRLLGNAAISARLLISGLAASLAFLMPGIAAANCDRPAYQQCMHLQADVEGMARAGDARYLGRSFGNKDIQCTTVADLDAAKQLISDCATRGEWTSSIQVADAQSILVQVNLPRLPPETPASAPEDAKAVVRPQGDIFNDDAQALPVEGIPTAPSIGSDSAPLSAVVEGVPERTIPVAPPVNGGPTQAQASSSQAESVPPSNNSIETAPAAQAPESRDFSPLFWGVAIGWLTLVICGIVAGWNQRIVVFRNYDDLAMMFFMLAVPLLTVWMGRYGGIFAIVFFFSFLLWASIRTWRDQSPRSIWAFALALITKLSLGILFVNSLWTVISPGGRTQLARARARASALGMLAILTPIVMRLVRDHEGIWSPRNVLTPYQRRRSGLSP